MPFQIDVPPPIQGGRHYSRPPIVEAVVDIKCDLPQEVGPDDLSKLVGGDEFPTVEELVEVAGQFDVSSGGLSGKAQRRRVGFRFRHADGKRIFQARLDGFSFSLLAPYDRWETFIAAAEQYWLRYREIAKPTKARRLGVRFINSITIESPQIEIKDYLRVAVDVPAYLPQVVSGYFMQISLPLSNFECMATVTSTFTPPPNQNSTSILLDIDVAQLVDIGLIDNVEAKGVADRLETLRRAKNYVFESCITDATRGVIK